VIHQPRTGDRAQMRDHACLENCAALNTTMLSPNPAELRDAACSIHGELFYKTLPAAQITTMLAARLRALEAALAAEKADGKVYRAACNVYHDCLEKAATTAAKSKPAQVYSIPSGTVTYITLEDTTVQYIVREVQDMARSNGPAVRQLMPK